MTDRSVTGIEFSGNLTGAKVLAAPFFLEQMSSSTRSTFVSEHADFGRPQPALRSIAEPV